MVKSYSRKTILTFYVCCLFHVLVLPMTFAQTAEQDNSFLKILSERDSVLTSYTLEELDNYRNEYQREITRLENERMELRQRGIRDGELFLLRNPKSKVGDKVMMRLAELFYENEQDNFEKRMAEFDRLYALYDRGEIFEAPDEPKKDITKALTMYVSVIEDYPQSDLVDDAFYNIGFLLEESGHADSAFAYYDKILNDLSDSPLVPDVYMRMGEYFFNPPLNDIQKAISYYEKVLNFRDSPRYDEALYRLGWSYYRLSDYTKAISYFTLLADDIDRTSPYDPLRKYTNPSLVDESVEYIGLSFLEHGGPEEAARYLSEIGGRDYGIAILKRIGDAYMKEKEDYESAISAYSLLLKIYPDSPIAPAVQNQIVQGYRRLENMPLAYLGRDLLFNNYKAGTDWWEKNQDPKVREQALEFAESALRDNITVILNRGQETDDVDLYRQSIVESKKYLEAFPDDSSAALIHWNMALTMDTKLDQSAQAFDEYLKISQLYWGTRFQRYAAENAVVVARDAAILAIETAEQKSSEEIPVTIADLKAEAGDQAGNAFSFREKMQLETSPLSPEEIRLAGAYDNFIKLFPHASETPTFLANAGALYYRHNHFRDALKYFNTLLRHFPGSEQVNQARYAIMESYFGKADFKSSEIVAKRILKSQGTEEVKSKARRRLAESVYLSAELLADGDKHFEAGNEYRRVVREAPRSEFADLALFNAALEYDKASEFMRAIETYNYLIATHPVSGYICDANNNLAFDYVELKDFNNAALTYEKLSTIHPDEEKARDALYNASYYFVKAENWKSAIRANQLFLQRFPQDDVADDLAFEIADFHKKENEEEQAQDALLKMVQTYPESPLVVNAFFRRGRYFQKFGNDKNAIIEYRKAIARSKKFVADDKEQTDYFAAESELAIAKLKFSEFEQIKFTMPESELSRKKDRKKDLLLEIVRHLGNCSSFGTYRVYEATYMVGAAYQDFALTWAGQEIPEMEPTRAIVARKEVNDAAALLYEKSGNAYRSGIVSLGRLAETYEKTLFEEATTDTLGAVTQDTAAVVVQDSTLRIAEKWVNKAKSGLASVNYEIAELSLNSARSVMNAPIPSGLGPFPTLVYRNQVLDKAVEPLISEALEAHRKNLVEADSFSIESQWVTLSKQKLIDTKNIIPHQYTTLSMAGLELVEEEFEGFYNLIYSNKSFEDIMGPIQDQSDDLANTIEFCDSTISVAKKKYKETILLAVNLGIEEEYLDSSKDSLMSSLLNFSLKCDSLSRDAKRRADQSRNDFVKSNNIVYEEGLFTFESNYFAFRDLERNILEEGYNLGKELAIDNVFYKNLTLQLVRFDPEKYAALLDLNLEKTMIKTDSTWKASPDYYEGWINPGFNASTWQNAMLVKDDMASVNYWLYLVKDSELPLDSLDVNSVIPPVLETEPVNQLYLRKMFSVKGLPVSCTINIYAEQVFNLYFNGDLIHRGLSVDSLYSGEFNLSELLVKGANVVALEVLDKEKNYKGLNATIEVKSLPEWESKLESLRPELTNKDVQEKMIIEQGRIP